MAGRRSHLGDFGMDLVLEFDGACWPNPGGPGGWGFTIVGQGGFLIEDHGTVPADSGLTNNLAEYLGLIAGLEALAALDKNQFDAVTIRGDSRMVINQAAGRWKCKKPHLQALLVQVAKLTTRIGRHRITFDWIPREENTRCDELSKQLEALRC